MKKIDIWPEELKITDQYIQTSVIVESSTNSRFCLWYRLPLEYQNHLTDSCDPFVIATIFLAMNQGSDLIVHGQVSPSLLDNLDEFQAAWSSWKPALYQRITIKADQEQESEKLLEEEFAISAFSGGVDSCFTAFSHCQGINQRRKHNLQAALMVHGFDIPIEQKEVFERALIKSKTIVSSLGLNLIPLATNFRQVINIDWEDVHGTAIASGLHLLKKRYHKGIIPSTYTYSQMHLLHGSNPCTDLLLSDNLFKIIHDGAEFSRLQKIESMLEWQEFLENLRVCWQGKHKDRNCGGCEKCIRTILNFRALGCKLPPCFEEDVKDQQILALKLRGYRIPAMEEIIEQIEIRNHILLSESWVKALRKSILKNKLMALVESRLSIQLVQQLRKLKLLLVKITSQGK